MSLLQAHTQTHTHKHTDIYKHIHIHIHKQTKKHTRKADYISLIHMHGLRRHVPKDDTCMRIWPLLKLRDGRGCAIILNH